MTWPGMRVAWQYRARRLCADTPSWGASIGSPAAAIIEEVPITFISLVSPASTAL